MDNTNIYAFFHDNRIKILENNESDGHIHRIGDDAARVVDETWSRIDMRYIGRQRGIGDVKRITRAKHIGAFARDDVQWTS